MDKLNLINHALDRAILEMVDNIPPRSRYSVPPPIPFLDFFASTPSTTDGYLSSARNALSLRRPASASNIYLAAARDEICRSCNPHPPAPLPPSQNLRPVATRPPCVSRDTWPPCEYKIHVTELQQIRYCLDNCMRMRRVKRKAAKSAQRRLNFLLLKTAGNNDKRLWAARKQTINISNNSQRELEIHELEILRLKARERLVIAAVSNFCVLFLS